MEGLALHYYTIRRARGAQGSATEFDEAEWYSTMKNGLGIEEFVTRHRHHHGSATIRQGGSR